MLGLLDRSYLYRFFKVFAGAIILLLGVAFIAKVQESSKVYAKYQPELHLYLKYLLYSFPAFLTYILPPAWMIAISFTVSTIKKNNELSVIMAAGRSFARVMSPFFAVSVLAAFVFFVYNEKVGFPSNFSSKNILLDIKGLGEEHRIRRFSDFISVRIDDSLYSLGHITRKTKEIEGFSLFEKTKDGYLHIKSKYARQEPGKLYLKKGTVTRFQPGVTEGRIGDRVPFEEYTLKLPKNLDLFNVGYDMDTDGEERNIFFLDQLVKERKLIGLKTQNYETEFYWHLGYPFILFFVTYIGAYLGMQLKKPSLAASIGLVLIYTVFYFFVMYFGTALGGSGTLPPFLAANLANILSLGISGYFFWRHRF